MYPIVVTSDMKEMLDNAGTLAIKGYAEDNITLFPNNPLYKLTREELEYCANNNYVCNPRRGLWYRGDKYHKVTGDIKEGDLLIFDAEVIDEYNNMLTNMPFKVYSQSDALYIYGTDKKAYSIRLVALEEVKVYRREVSR